jgi:hypothetical protein
LAGSRGVEQRDESEKEGSVGWVVEVGAAKEAEEDYFDCAKGNVNVKNRDGGRTSARDKRQSVGVRTSLGAPTAQGTAPLLLCLTLCDFVPLFFLFRFRSLAPEAFYLIFSLPKNNNSKKQQNNIIY